MSNDHFGREYGVLDMDNGLRIYFHDQSRPVAGDRSLLQLLIRIPIPVLEAYFNGFENPSEEHRAFVEHFGEEIELRQTKSRNFVATADVPALLEELKDEFLGASLAYLSRSIFPEKYVLKQHKEWKEGVSWRQAQESHMREVNEKERESE